MSDLSVLQQSFGLAPATLAPLLGPPQAYERHHFEAPPLSPDVQPHEVDFRRLRGPQEVARILHLRTEIHLPAAALGDASFAAREKKETRSEWSVPSCASVNT
ncbi:MAG TPA: hypothetical protein VFE74_05815 [Ramlibacter sp.]|jgi:hypothetical protein|nr:hypothetical protein [Ramlibacter sp.]